MKKIATLLLFVASFFVQSLNAQNITCNAEFGIVYQTGNNIQFNPAMTGDPLTTQHYWIYGDGNVASVVSPSHIYLFNGTYTAKHIIIKFSGGVLICKDSFQRVIQIQATCNIVAGFVLVSMTTPNTFQFQNTTLALNSSDSIRWTFGDGSSSNQINPTHTYAQSGTYNVCLRVQQRNSAGTLSNCIGEICHAITVQPPIPCNLVTGFNYTVPAPNTFHFQNTSLPLNPTDSIRWTFGDGSSSNQVSPTHTYYLTGTYNICLKIQQRNLDGTLSNCVGEICHAIIIQSTNTCNLVAEFIPALVTPNTYHFQNTSIPLQPTDSIRWTFGDGSSSNQVNPTHTYTQPGTYNVCLRIQQRNLSGTLLNCIREICHAIIIQSTNTCNLVAGFIPALVTPNTYHFQNTSIPLQPTDSIRWTFGDGSSSNQVNPTHTFANTGSYNVCLRIQQRNSSGTLSNCVREICHVMQAQIPANCNLVAAFIPIITSQNAYHFQNTSFVVNTTDSIRWTFGDGTSSNQMNPTHTYSQPGTYNVCLRIQRRNSAGTLSNCVGEICHTVVVMYNTTCTLVAGFTPTLIAPNAYHFENTSTPLNPTDSIRWTFGDGTSSNQVNPNHTFPHPGTYYVCLRVQKRNSLGTLSNCVREICHTVVVGTTSACILQPFPNPATNTINVNIFLNQPQMIDIYIYSSTNLLVKERHQQGVAGNNVATLTIGDLMPGIYTMRMVHGNDVCYGQFIKL